MNDKLTPNFSIQEIQCHCGCGTNNVNHLSLHFLQGFREHLDMPIIVNSACRCYDHNEKIGGANFSSHLSAASVQCQAFDISVNDMSCLELMDKFEAWDKPRNFRGRGLYPHNNFIHIDNMRVGIVRWIRDAHGKYEYVDKF